MKDSKKVEASFKIDVIVDFINHLLKTGVIENTDLSNSRIINEKVSKFLTGKEIKVDIVIDHREDLLKVVEQFNGKYNELSISLYATFIEHTLNKIIRLECETKNIDINTTTEIIRNVNIIGKCTWLLKLLGLPSLKNDYVKLIQKISEERNSFMHYKWKPILDDKIEDHGMSVKIIMLIKYLKNYETKLEYKGNKNKLIKIVKSKTMTKR